MHDSPLTHRPGAGSRPDLTTHVFYDHSSAKRTNTDTLIVETLRQQYPNLTLIVVDAYSSNLLSFASTSHATVEPITDPHDPLSAPLTWTSYAPPLRRLDGEVGATSSSLQYGKYLYRWRGHEYVMYYAKGDIGSTGYPETHFQYVLATPGEAEAAVPELVRVAGAWAMDLHEQIWVFDGGYWQKSAQLYQAVMKARWEDVILDEDMKKAVRNDVERFFDSRERYAKLRVPWKRGVIYYGSPGNGKTISIKAHMHTLYKRQDPVPTLYVRSLRSSGGSEYSIKQIFIKARQTAPCLLVFEDLDSLVTDQGRSYFLNEVDGLQSNDGILMIGSTNHLERLDPGISKRPSRFDRKFDFPKPNEEQRAKYCQYWRHKVADNEDIAFPKVLTGAIAGITDGFSFAFLQEAFVASLLAIAAKDDGGDEKAWQSAQDKDDLEQYELWREIKRQVKILREEM